MFGAHPRVIEARGHAVRRLDLPVGILEQVAQAAVEDTGSAPAERGSVATAVESLPGSFDPYGEGVNAIVHAAAAMPPASAARIRAVNLEGTANMVAFARRWSAP